MSAWRREAALRFPDLWRDEFARQTINLFFFELLPTIRDAHRSRDEDTLRRRYDFARRCFRHAASWRTLPPWRSMSTCSTPGTFTTTYCADSIPPSRVVAGPFLKLVLARSNSPSFDSG